VPGTSTSVNARRTSMCSQPSRTTSGTAQSEPPRRCRRWPAGRRDVALGAPVTAELRPRWRHGTPLPGAPVRCRRVPSGGPSRAQAQDSTAPGGLSTYRRLGLACGSHVGVHGDRKSTITRSGSQRDTIAYGCAPLSPRGTGRRHLAQDLVLGARSPTAQTAPHCVVLDRYRTPSCPFVRVMAERRTAEWFRYRRPQPSGGLTGASDLRRPQRTAAPVGWRTTRS
jgi:hypothetical protein